MRDEIQGQEDQAVEGGGTKARVAGPQLSPAIILMSGGAHEGGMLQSDLFTRRSQNLVSGNLRRSGFWRYGQFF